MSLWQARAAAIRQTYKMMVKEPDQDNQETVGDRQAGDSQTLLWNMSGLLLLGVLGTVWVFIYTDWSPAIGGLLTLTGAFAWIALLLQLISDKRKDIFQDAFERRVLLKRSLWRELLGVGVGMLVLTAITGTIEVRSYRDNSQRSLMVSRAAAEKDVPPAREVALPAHSRRKFLFLGHGPFQVKPSGLPALKVRAGVFWPRVLVSPDHFIRAPVLLLRPSLGLSRVASRSNKLKLLIWRDNKVLVGPMPFRGRAVWVGCKRDVAIPQWIQDRWKADEPMPWLPAVDTDPLVTLHDGDRLGIRLETPYGLYLPEIQHVANKPHGIQDFPYEIVLELPGFSQEDAREHPG